MLKLNLIDTRSIKSRSSVDFISQETIKKVNDFHKGFRE